MNQEIHFKGLSLTPDDHHAALGELSLCANTELHNGALRPSILNKTTIGSLKVGNTVAKMRYLHKDNGYTHYIASIGSALYWFQEDGTYVNLIHDFGTLAIYSLQSIGNTLIVLTSDGIHYAKWSKNTYEYIGSHLPELNLSFGLRGMVEHSEDFDVQIRNSHGVYGSPNDNGQRVFSIENVSEVTENVLGEVNKFIDKHHTEGRFIFPFFVRYAYRLYNGSLTMHSAPVLMLCSSKSVPYVFLRSNSGSNNVLEGSCKVVANTYSLDYKYNPVTSGELEKWEDIVDSIEIFISQPLYRYDAAGEVKSGQYLATYVDDYLDEDHCICGRDNAYSLGTGYHGVHTMKEFITANSLHSDFIPNEVFDLPVKKDNDDNDLFDKTVKECSEFYLLKSVKPSELPSVRTVINIGEGVLNNIVAREKMEDDYDSHDTIIPKVSFTYNSRLNVADITKRLYDGYNPGAQFAYADELPTEEVQIAYYIKQDGHDFVVNSPSFSFTSGMPIPYVYYPNTNAYQAVIKRDSGTKVVSLKPHAMLNGAVYFDLEVFNTSSADTLQPDPDYLESHADPDATVFLSNKLYTSEVNNPFYFPLEGINTIGIGTILGLASTTRALSQGQFGQYPLMVFCTDGIWALDVSPTGSFSAIHPISREVCVNPASICQLDQSVLFATKRGIAQIVESSVSPVSDVLDGPVFDVAGKLPVIAEHASDLSPLVAFKVHPFDFFANEDTQLLYDFVNQRVLAVKADGVEDCAYVFSITDASWSTMNLGKCLTVVNAYPYPYIQRTDGTLLCLDKNYSYGIDLAQGESHAALVITRAISFSSLMQAIQEFQQINDCMDTPTLVIHGSNDNIHWSMVGRVKRNHAAYLPAHPFRWFRISLFLNMRPAEKYSKLILGVIEKYQKL